MFAREKQNYVKALCVLIDSIIEVLLAMTWAFPKFNCIFLTTRKENSKFIENKHGVRLEGMQQRIKDFFLAWRESMITIILEA